MINHSYLSPKFNIWSFIYSFAKLTYIAMCWEQKAVEICSFNWGKLNWVKLNASKAIQQVTEVIRKTHVLNIKAVQFDLIKQPYENKFDKLHYKKLLQLFIEYWNGYHVIYTYVHLDSRFLKIQSANLQKGIGMSPLSYAQYMPHWRPASRNWHILLHSNLLHGYIIVITRTHKRSDLLMASISKQYSSTACCVFEGYEWIKCGSLLNLNWRYSWLDKLSSCLWRHYSLTNQGTVFAPVRCGRRETSASSICF